MPKNPKPVYKLIAPEPPGPDSPEFEAYNIWLLDMLMQLEKISREGAGKPQLAVNAEGV